MKLLIGKNNFLLFLMLCSSALALSKDTQFFNQSPVVKAKRESQTFPSNPVLGNSNSFPQLSAQGVIAIDLESGVPLYEKNPDAPLLPASTTKIITALVAMDVYSLDQIIKTGSEINVTGQKMGLFVGEEITVENLIYGLLVYSANDAAMTLAENHPGGYDAFIDAMNVKAEYLSMNNTHFENPVGLDGNYQRSTARDLVRASEVAMRNPIFAKMVGTKEILITDASGKYSHDLKNLNQLLGEVPGVVGVKTGWTESARENLVTYIIRDGHKVLIALLGSQDRFGETRELIDWIFSNYTWDEVKLP
jgi:D-alanyl-D-alanine carboxypeptidase